MNNLRAQWDRVGAWLAITLGAIAVLVGWLGVSDTGYVFEQMPYIVSGGIGGLFLLGLGTALLLSADFRDEWRKLDAIEQVLRDADGGHITGEAETTEATATPSPAPARRRTRPLEKAAAQP